MRAMLGRFGLEGQHHLTPIIKLSGGQKSRVVFTSIALQNPHILLLDEPTNHLDMQSIDALCDALEEFEGGVVVISHDSQLLSRLCDNEQSQVRWAWGLRAEGIPLPPLDSVATPHLARRLQPP
jgi:ATP-binding cassette subfamily F protein 1